MGLSVSMLFMYKFVCFELGEGTTWYSGSIASV